MFVGGGGGGSGSGSGGCGSRHGFSCCSGVDRVEMKAVVREDDDDADNDVLAIIYIYI